MLTLAGSPAFSSGRLEKRLARVRADNPGVLELTADWMHFVDVREELSAVEQRTLETLLTYGPRAIKRPLSGLVRVVVPRLGTISPWSTKATDIARLSGLDKVKRLERGIVYTLKGDVRDERALRRAIADRMTETVLGAVDDAASLF